MPCTTQGTTGNGQRTEGEAELRHPALITQHCLLALPSSKSRPGPISCESLAAEWPPMRQAQLPDRLIRSEDVLRALISQVSERRDTRAVCRLVVRGSEKG